MVLYGYLLFGIQCQSLEKTSLSGHLSDVNSCVIKTMILVTTEHLTPPLTAKRMNKDTVFFLVQVVYLQVEH